MKRNNPGCQCCGALPCGPEQTVCDNFSPTKTPEYYDIEISGIPASITRDKINGSISRDRTIMTGLDVANGTYRHNFDFDLCVWEDPIFDNTYSGTCEQYVYGPGQSGCGGTLNSSYGYTNTIRVDLFGNGTIGSVSAPGSVCPGGEFPGFTFPEAGDPFDLCVTGTQTKTVTVSYDVCSGGLLTSVNFIVTIKLTPSFVDL